MFVYQRGYLEHVHSVFGWIFANHQMFLEVLRMSLKSHSPLISQLISHKLWTWQLLVMYSSYSISVVVRSYSIHIQWTSPHEIHISINHQLIIHQNEMVLQVFDLYPNNPNIPILILIYLISKASTCNSSRLLTPLTNHIKSCPEAIPLIFQVIF